MRSRDTIQEVSLTEDSLEREAAALILQAQTISSASEFAKVVTRDAWPDAFLLDGREERKGAVNSSELRIASLMHIGYLKGIPPGM